MSRSYVWGKKRIVKKRWHIDCLVCESCRPRVRSLPLLYKCRSRGMEQVEGRRNWNAMLDWRVHSQTGRPNQQTHEHKGLAHADEKVKSVSCTQGSKMSSRHPSLLFFCLVRPLSPPSPRLMYVVAQMNQCQRCWEHLLSTPAPRATPLMDTNYKISPPWGDIVQTLPPQPWGEELTLFFTFSQYVHLVLRVDSHGREAKIQFLWDTVVELKSVKLSDFFVPLHAGAWLNDTTGITDLRPLTAED